MKKLIGFLVLLGMFAACSDNETPSVSKRKKEGLNQVTSAKELATEQPQVFVGGFDQITTEEQLPTDKPQLPDGWPDPNP